MYIMVVTHALSLNINRSDGERNLIGRRTQSDRTADGIRSGGGRNPIGRRTESNRAADGIRSDGVRSTMTKRNNRSKQK